jgi:uroporphyrinogen III methyltransferase/synthase
MVVRSFLKYDADTPCAIIQDSTLPSQKVILAPLSETLTKAKREGIRPPCIFIAGEVVKLKERLSWFESSPLFG